MTYMFKNKTMNINFNKTPDNLIPAIIQDNETKNVLMLGYMNQEALDQTLATKKVTFFSRTKNRLWTKGEESGNFLELVSIKEDCDNDTLLVKVIEIGTKNLGGPYAFPTTDIFGTAYTDKKINFDLLKEFIETNKNFKIVQCFSHTINSDDIKIEKCKKINSISDLTKRDDKVKITANIDGVEETSFTVTNFNSKGFTIMHKEEEKKKQKLYNYIIENQ